MKKFGPPCKPPGAQGPSDNVGIDTSEFGDRMGMNWSAAHAADKSGALECARVHPHVLEDSGFVCFLNSEGMISPC